MTAATRKTRSPGTALFLAFGAGAALALPVVLAASTVTLPHTFTNGAVASASDVNANFSAVATAVNDNAARIALLEGTSSTLDCYTTGWSAQTACASLPEATPPSCNPGYTFTGIANFTASDAGCGASANTRAQVKSRCCRVVP